MFSTPLVTKIESEVGANVYFVNFNTFDAIYDVIMQELV